MILPRMGDHRRESRRFANVVSHAGLGVRPRRGEQLTDVARRVQLDENVILDPRAAARPRVGVRIVDILTQ